MTYRTIVRFVLAVSLVALAEAGDFCAVVKDDFPTGATCLQPAKADDPLSFKIDYTKVMIPSRITGIGQVPKLSLAFELDFDACASSGASIDLSASLKLPAVPALLNTAIAAAVDVTDDAGFKALSYSTNDYTMTVSEKLTLSNGISVSIPIFYVDIASVDLLLTATLSGNADALTLVVTLDACVEFIGDEVKDLFPSGGKICASQLPDCRGCTSDATKTCNWVGATFPCTGTTGYQDDCSVNVLDGGSLSNGDINAKREAADTACEFMGSPDIPQLLDDPPWTIVSKTWSLGDACAPPSPPPVNAQSTTSSVPASSASSSSGATSSGSATTPSTSSSPGGSAAGVDIVIVIVVIIFLVIGILVAFRFGIIHGQLKKALQQVPLVRRLDRGEEFPAAELEFNAESVSKA